MVACFTKHSVIAVISRAVMSAYLRGYKKSTLPNQACLGWYQYVSTDYRKRKG
jgi:hypothetical protein